MAALLRLMAIRLLLCMAATGLLWWLWMSFFSDRKQALFPALLSTVFFYAAALARPLIDLLSEWRRHARQQAWADVEGQFYAFHGQSVAVVEDIDHHRWVRLQDVRKVVGWSAPDSALRRIHGPAIQSWGQPPHMHLHVEALIAALAGSSQAKTLRFRHWLEREVAIPSRRLQGRFGTESPRAQGAAPPSQPGNTSN
jgi:hypothetical protein